ncbi:hypothetical protein [Nakamurella endophytica]|uniref:Uncharacterized protein n=1 Tax=Nakamurella endophytica TaxID=1748367 RepID=A0A917SU83_9ACTN|nr:hypothetical protein [Nakamurella endophytica]GGL95531.1 hypothetical protein GCM10011594_13950 [Nakamurella endophytica]
MHVPDQVPADPSGPPGPDGPAGVPRGPGGTVGRRALLAGVGSAALLAAAGCNPFQTGGGGRTVTVTSTAPPAPDPIAGLIAVTRLHVLRLNAALTGNRVNKAQAQTLQMVRRDRQAHLDALLTEQARSAGRGAPTTAPVTGTVQLPGDGKAVLGAVRADVLAALQGMTDAVAGAGRYRAALFGSIAACLASHRVVLA